MEWLKELSERERMEISWARDYATLYTKTGFYTEGHNRLLLLAHLAELLDGKETAQEEEPPPRS